MGTNKFCIYRTRLAGWKLRQKLMLQFEADFLLWEPHFLLIRPSTDWMRLSHIIEGNILYLKSTDLDVNNIYKILSQQHLG